MRKYAMEVAREMHAIASPNGIPFEGLSKAMQSEYLRKVCAVITAQKSLADRGGPKLVDRKATNTMIDAAICFDPKIDGVYAWEMWDAMHDRASSIPDHGDEE